MVVQPISNNVKRKNSECRLGRNALTLKRVVGRLLVLGLLASRRASRHKLNRPLSIRSRQLFFMSLRSLLIGQATPLATATLR